MTRRQRQPSHIVFLIDHLHDGRQRNGSREKARKTMAAPGRVALAEKVRYCLRKPLVARDHEREGPTAMLWEGRRPSGRRVSGGSTVLFQQEPHKMRHVPVFRTSPCGMQPPPKSPPLKIKPKPQIKPQGPCDARPVHINLKRPGKRAQSIFQARAEEWDGAVGRREEPRDRRCGDSRSAYH